MVLEQGSVHDKILKNNLLFNISMRKFYTLAIIDSLENFYKAYEKKPDIYITDNIFLYKKLDTNKNIKVFCTENYITQKKINEIGKLFANWGSELDFFLNDLQLIKKINRNICEGSYFFMTLLSLFCRIIGLKKL